VQPPSGQLNIASNKTKEVVNTIVDELSELFPDSWFHASGDEVVMDCWSNDTEIAAYLKQHNLTTLELFEQFVNGMQDHIRTHNKTVMVWQEMILEYNFTLPKDTVVHVWVGSSGVKATTEKGYRTIVSRYVCC
jgi:hexosaminidase